MRGLQVGGWQASQGLLQGAGLRDCTPRSLTSSKPEVPAWEDVGFAGAELKERVRDAAGHCTTSLTWGRLEPFPS